VRSCNDKWVYYWWLIQINLTYAVWPFSLTKIVSIVIKDGIYGKLSQKVTCNSICQFSDWIESKLQHHYSILYNNYIYVSLHFCGETLFLSCLSVTQFVSTTPLKLLNRISWNLVGSKDTICSCAYYQEILIYWTLWEICPFELRNFPKFTTEAACQCNSSETTEQNFMKLGR
jgi:hypothetical protein